MGNKPTLADIASELGLSVPTVHRSLHNVGRVSSKTRDMVLEKAAEMGYSTNLAASRLSSKKQFHVAILTSETSFYEDILFGFEQNTSQYKMFGIVVHYYRTKAFDAIEQIQKLEEIIASDVSFVAVALPAAHPSMLNPLIATLRQKGTHVITYDNDAPQSGRELFVGSNGYASGAVCAQLYSSILPKEATVAILPSFVTAIGLKERVKGFRDGCEAHGTLRTLGVFEYIDSEQDAYQTAKQIIETMHPDAIYVNSMMGTMGCARAIRETDSTGNIFMIGYDFNEQIMQDIQDGVLYGSLYQHQYTQGARLAQLLQALCIQGGTPPDNTYITPAAALILKSNLNDFAKAFIR